MAGLPDSRDILLIRSGTVAGSYLIVDLTQTPPALVSAEDVIPAAILQVLKDIQANQEKIMAGMAEEQQELTDLGTAMQAVADHVTASGQQTSAAVTALQAWMDQNAAQPLDFTGANNALAALQAADASNQAAGSTLAALVPQAPATPLDTPVPDPGPPAAPPDTIPPPDAAPADGSTTDLPPDQPPPDAPLS